MMLETIQIWGKYPLVFLTGLAAASLVSFVWCRVAPFVGFMDSPGVRRIHSRPIPTAGGIAIFAGFHIACAVIYGLPWLPFAGQLTARWWHDFIVISAFVVVVGAVDDRFRLTPGMKLMGQVLIVAVAEVLGIRLGNVFGFPLPFLADVVLTAIWFLVLMNAFNLIDGMDGLAAGLGIVAATGLGISLFFRRYPSDVLVCLALAGACIGFLRHNFHPARIFMGDTGSMFLGCAIAAVALGTSSKGTAMASIGVPILAVGVPILDAGLAVWRRSVRSVMKAEGPGLLEEVASGDSEHIHHRLLGRGLSQRQVAVILYAMGIFLSAVGIFSSVFREYAMAVLLLSFLVGIYVVIRHLAWIELYDSGSAVLQGVRRSTVNSRAVLVYPVMDILSLAIGLAMAMALVAERGGVGSVKHEWIRMAPWAVGMPFILLVASRSYSRVWSRARVSEYALTGVAVIVGILCWFGGMMIVRQGSVRELLVLVMLYIGMTIPAVVGSRAFVRVLQDLMAWKCRIKEGKADGLRVLLVGAGPECQLFLKEASLLYDTPTRMAVVGLVDEDPGLKGRWVYGYRVMGGVDDLRALIKATGAEEIVVVGRLDTPAVDRIVSIGAQCGVVVRQWMTTLRTLGAAQGAEAGTCRDP